MDGWIDGEQWLGAEGDGQVGGSGGIPRKMRERVAAAARRIPRN